MPEETGYGTLDDILKDIADAIREKTITTYTAPNGTTYNHYYEITEESGNDEWVYKIWSNYVMAGYSSGNSGKGVVIYYGPLAPYTVSGYDTVYSYSSSDYYYECYKNETKQTGYGKNPPCTSNESSTVTTNLALVSSTLETCKAFIKKGDKIDAQDFSTLIRSL